MATPGPFCRGGAQMRGRSLRRVKRPSPEGEWAEANGTGVVGVSWNVTASRAVRLELCRGFGSGATEAARWTFMVADDNQ